MSIYVTRNILVSVQRMHFFVKRLTVIFRKPLLLPITGKLYSVLQPIYLPQVYLSNTYLLLISKHLHYF